LITPDLQQQHKALSFKYKNATFLKETNVQYATIQCWWYFSRVAPKNAIHEFHNWLGF
jgi:hypothetical protein